MLRNLIAFVNYPLFIYANIYNMIVGFSISFVLLLLQYYSLTITTNVSLLLSDDQ